MIHFQIGNRTFVCSKQLIAVIIAVMILIVVGILGRTTIAAQLRDWKVLPAQEQLTELYFFDHERLPAAYRPDQPQPVAFTIRNLEGSALRYTYRITATPEGGATTPLKEGSLRISNTAARTVQESVTMPDLGARVRIDVTINNNQSISYWVERNL